MSPEELLATWKERLERFKAYPQVAKGMDTKVAMGAQNARVILLTDCIEELENAILCG